jgi:NAD(P)-dependent dehydrogenase (short-subunit alcohol dehydrogenase family)
MALKTMEDDAVVRKLSGRVAIVTGAGSGIGRGIAVALAKEGTALILVGRTPETLNATVELIRPLGTAVHSVQGSVAERDTANRAVSEALSRLGRLDILVNNAHTFAPLLSVEETPEADFRTHMESGLYGTLYFMQAAFPHMLERGGSIMNFGSMAGLQGWAKFAPYAASKEAIRALSRSASRDWGKHRIRVNVVVPSAHSPISDKYMSDPATHKAVIDSIPLGYLGDPELDIGRVAVFLASDDSRYVTGQTLHVDGGM